MPDTTPPPVNPFKKTTATAKRASTFGIIAIILAILAGVLAWFAWIETHRITLAIKAYADQISQQTKTTIQAEQTTIAKLQNQFDTLQKKFEAVQNKLDQMSHISIQAYNQRAFSEASYLIHIANLQLTISRNVDAALSLMRLANEQLKKITSPSVTRLKQAIAKDIVSLENAPKLDIARLLAQLDQLKTGVQALPSLPTTQDPSTTDDTQKTTKPPWYKKFTQLVIIRHDKKPIKPLLSPQELLFLKQNVQLKISEAEWAVLYQNPTLYQQSLQDAQQMLESYYPNQAAMTDILKDLQSLSEINIRPELPDLSNTLKILNDTSLRDAQ